MKGDFQVGPWLVRPDMNTIESEGEERFIEPKAMDVLVFLADHAGEVLAKERIINAIWPDAFVTDDVLTHAIACLRKALGDDSKNPHFIRTVPRRGYLLIPHVKPQPEVSLAPKHPDQNNAEQSAQETGDITAAVDRKPHRWLWLAAVPVLLLTTAFGIYWFGLSRSEEPQLDRAVEQRKFIAVLPFENPSGNAEDDYFSAGITEDITTALTKIGDLRVVGRTSSFFNRSGQKSLRDVVRQLGVGTILEGSVRRTGQQVRIVAQLIAAETDEVLWAETYDRNLDDIFAVQSDVAERIASALRVKLTPEETRRVESQLTSNFEAYNLCLQGRHFRYRETLESSHKAVELFEKAVQIDPNYALAYAGLAEAYIFLRQTSLISEGISWYQSQRKADLLEKAEAAAQKALKLDDALAEAHVSMGLVNHSRGDRKAFLQNLRRAIELNPHLANARRELGLELFRHHGKLREGLTELREAHQLDPLSTVILANLGSALLANGLIEETVSKARQIRELSPTPMDEILLLGEVHFVLSDWRRAEHYCKKFLALDRAHRAATDETFARGLLRRIYWLESRRQEARKEAERFIKPNPDLSRAILYAGLVADMEGDHLKALELFERAYRLSSTPVERINYRAFWHSYEYSTWLGHTYWRLGRLNEAQEKLEESLEFDRQRLAAGDESPQVRIGLAEIYAIRGEKEEAYRWLQQGIEAGFLEYTFLERHPFFANLHDDSRFKRMMAEIKAKVDVMRHRVREMEKEKGWDEL